jgi:hypothetical protein
LLGPGAALAALPAAPPPVVSTAQHLPGAQVLAVAIEGIFAGPLGLIPCLSGHVVNTALRKLMDPPEEDGLGWDDDDAADFMQAVIDAFYEVDGIDVDVDAPRHSPLLDYEDGMVVASAIKAEAHYLITKDNDFRAAVVGKYGLEVMSPLAFLRRLSDHRSLAAR